MSLFRRIYQPLAGSDSGSTTKDSTSPAIRTVYQDITDLGEQIENANKKNYITHCPFVPVDKIQGFVTRDSVKSTFRSAGVDDESLVDFVLKDAPRLFLILVMMTSGTIEKISLLTDFKDDGVSDKSLPIEFEKDSGGGRFGYCTEQKPDQKQRFFAIGRWERNDRDTLLSYQWRFLAPVFGGETFYFHFNPQRVLPYVNGTLKPASSGFFGEVSRIEIHRAHIGDLATASNTEHVPIAIKKAKEEEELNRFFDKEADNLQKLREYKSPHLIRPIAAYEIGTEQYLMFPWAAGGNLDQYWKQSNGDARELVNVKWIVSQLAGLCSALEELHESNCRHGDLKPENILWFRQDNGKGTLQIADLGLAAFHEKELHTNLRKEIHTSTPSGTKRYEPPEMHDERNSDEPRSRAYDIWTMGCIMLELLIWLRYGYETVKTFQKNTKYLWDDNKQNGRAKDSFHPMVTLYIESMARDLEEKTVYKDLLNLVQNRLLLIHVSESYESKEGYREIASGLYARVEKIHKRCENNDSSYLPLIRLSDPPHPLPQSGTVLQESGSLAMRGVKDVPSASQALPPLDESPLEDVDHHNVLVRAPTGESNSDSQKWTNISTVTNHQQQSSKLNDTWWSSPDNDFARRLFDLISWERVKPDQKALPTLLCSSCKALDLTQLFDLDLDLSVLEEKSRICELCDLLLSVLGKEDIRPPRRIRLRQDGPIVGVEDGPDLLSIYNAPGERILKGTQLGLPRLLGQGSPEQFTLLKTWIQDCDSTHDMCCRADEGGTLSMPTRLIETSHTIRLIDSASINPSKYVALSHCWGLLKENERFCTYRNTIEALKICIDFKTLPRMFCDAIAVTRGLGIKYIWIDSLCIIQDDEIDWQRESSNMEQVFSNAYCTIGASSAVSSLDGFLKARAPRSCLQIQSQDGGELYICHAIDNFQRDVELGELNRRGWVLQERALSRRSIYYTSKQVYWECGKGIRCETLARLQNSKASFLGDANFPKFAVEYYRDGRQVLIQDLYERYSGLAFTDPTDRPVEILGLQERLARAFRTDAAWGVFAVYFARGILWQRRMAGGMDKVDNDMENPNYYALILYQDGVALRKCVWERVGVASLKPAQVESEGSWVDVG